MEFNKKVVLRNLKALEAEIKNRVAEAAAGDVTDVSIDDLMADCKAEDKMNEDLMFVRGLMDDIECDRITEFPMVERTNLMSGKTYLEDEDTPLSCSPASETYWSM